MSAITLSSLQSRISRGKDLPGTKVELRRLSR